MKQFLTALILLPLRTDSFLYSPSIKECIWQLEGSRDSSIETKRRRNDSELDKLDSLNQFSQLQMICDEENEFNMNVGKAIDTLRNDYPKIFQSCPDFSIYHDNLEVIDPSGVKLNGLANYKNFFRVLRAIISIFYNHEESGLTFRIMFDQVRKSIRLSWNAVLVPKGIIGGYRNMMHLDGISVYDFDNTGVIIQHRVEHLILNDRPLMLTKGIFEAVANEAQGIPVLGIEGASFAGVDFQAPTFLSINFNQASFDERNSYRLKYGIPPLTVEEFEEVEARVRVLEQETKQRKIQLQSTAQLIKENELQQRNGNNMFSNFLRSSCETNFDCERPQVCCDFIFKKVCCASGVGIYNPPLIAQPIPVTVTVGNENF